MGLATSRLIIKAVQRPNAIPTVPTKTENHSELAAGAFGANPSRRSEPIGHSDADIAHRIPRPRSDRVTTSGVRSARTSRKKMGNNPQLLANSTMKIVFVVEMNPEMQNEIGRCQNNCGLRWDSTCIREMM